MFGKYFLILFIGIFLSITLVAQTEETSQTPQEVKVYMNSFIEAFNSGDSIKIGSFVSSTHHPKLFQQVSLKDLTNRLMWVYYQYGPIEAKRFENTGSTMAMMWCRSKTTKTWVGFAFMFNKDSPRYITTIGVDRGQSPPVSERYEKAATSKELVKRIDQYFVNLKGSPFFSGSVLIAHKGKPIFITSSGMANKRQRIRNDNRTRFFISSTGKMFAAISIAQLHEKGLLQYNDKLSKFIPEYPRNISEKVTIHHLLTHTSGIELDDEPDFKEASSNAKSVEELVDLQIKYLLPKVKDEFVLTDEYNYTNEGFVLLARIVEVITGRKYWAYVKDNILTPAEMRQTLACYPDKLPPNTATGYTSRSSLDGGYLGAVPLEKNVASISKFPHPAAGLVSTPEDLLHFANYIYNGRLINKESFKEITSDKIKESPSNNYGYGMEIANTIAGRSIGHSGAVLGFSSRLDIYPDREYTVIVLANGDQFANNVADFIRELLSL